MSKVLKKLTLNKEVVARISGIQMNHLKGGYEPTDVICTNFLTCRTNVTCYGKTCEGTCDWKCINTICPIRCFYVSIK